MNNYTPMLRQQQPFVQHPLMPTYQGWRANESFDRDTSSTSTENRAKTIEAGPGLLRKELNLEETTLFNEHGDLFMLGTKIHVVKDMLQCNNLTIYWILHSVCSESI
jgi:hypothetical protein